MPASVRRRCRPRVLEGACGRTRRRVLSWSAPPASSQGQGPLHLLADLDAQVADAETRIGGLIPATRYAVLSSGPGWGTARVGAYAAAVGEPTRWGSHATIYRAAGLNPAQYESAGHRRDSGISREGSVKLRRALLDLGIGLWHRDPAARAYAAGLRQRGKPGGIIATALARRAKKIAFAMVRDQTVYDPTVWQREEG